MQDHDKNVENHSHLMISSPSQTNRIRRLLQNQQRFAAESQQAENSNQPAFETLEGQVQNKSSNGKPSTNHSSSIFKFNVREEGS